MPNRLQDEASPYLQQHAQNPVDWYPWCPEALEAAVRLDRPIFLSIGYSACHWCHVMEHESFEDPEIASFLNQHFISIKVDREERPDLDQIYMLGVMAVNGGRGGWPLSAFLMPDQKFFYGGTYWPARSRNGLPGFLDVLKRVQQVFSSQREQATTQSQQMMEHIEQLLSGRAVPKDGVALPMFEDLNDREKKNQTAEVVSEAINQLIQSCDWQWGGFGDAPKFPHAMDLRLLFQMERRIEKSRRRRSEEEGEYEAETLRLAAENALDRMAAGGIYDHIGGGFARYSVDAQWLVPHFEKMLYDNALLLQAYADGVLRLNKGHYADVIRQTFAYLHRELRHPAGGFYSSQDADSEGEEGKYYLWNQEEVKAQLPGDLGTRFCTAFDISMDGNFEGRSIPNRRKSMGVPVKELGLSEEDLSMAIEKLLSVRAGRVAPGTDYKILTSWNALTIAALAEAGLAINDPHLIQAAVEAAQFAQKYLRRDDGRLWHAWRDRRESVDANVPGDAGFGYLNAYLDDYAGMAVAMVTLYRATFEEHWLSWAFELADRIISDFADSSGGFFFTSHDHETLAARGKDLQDNSVPSANSLTARCMWDLFRISNDGRYWDAVNACVKDGWALSQRSPAAAGHLIATLDRSLGPNRELVLLLPEGSDIASWRSMLGRLYLPNDLLLVRMLGMDREQHPAMEGHFRGRACVEGHPTLFVCVAQVCESPIVGAEAIQRALVQM